MGPPNQELLLQQNGSRAANTILARTARSRASSLLKKPVNLTDTFRSLVEELVESRVGAVHDTDSTGMQYLNMEPLPSGTDPLPVSHTANSGVAAISSYRQAQLLNLARGREHLALA
jgi:hypothetical protein